MADTIINGGDVTMSISGNTIAQATSHSLSISMSARDTSNKTSGVYTSRESGRMDVSMSCEGMGFYSGTTGMNFLLNALVEREPVALVMYENSHQYATGNFYITSAEISAPDQDNVTFSVSFELANTFALGSF